MKVRWPGIEPGSTAWKAAMLTIIPPTLTYDRWTENLLLFVRQQTSKVRIQSFQTSQQIGKIFSYATNSQPLLKNDRRFKGKSFINFYLLQSLLVFATDEPMLTGSCVRTGITAILNFHWSVFKFSLIFDENPEGNSYYMNKAVLEYNQVGRSWISENLIKPN